MNKKKFVVLTLMVVVMFVLAACLLVACNKNNDETPAAEEIEATEGLLITNSDFKVVDTSKEEYPRNITNWTGAKMYSSTEFRDDVVAGAINLGKDLYNANKELWDDDNNDVYNALVKGGRYGDDDKIKNALMVYMPKQSTNSDGDKINGPTAFGYTSASFTLQKGSYYKLSVDVLTIDIDGDGKSTAEPGARIYVSSNTYAEFAQIDTKGEWKTYEVYIETSPSSTTSLSLLLGLGKYSSSYTLGLTTGYAFFDNVVLTCLDDENTDAIEGGDKFAAAKAAELTAEGELDGHKVTTTSLKVPNGRFDFGSLNPTSSAVPNSWSIVMGNSGKEDAAPSGAGQMNAIIDVKKFADNFLNYSSAFTIKASASEPSSQYRPAEALGDDKIKNAIAALPTSAVGSNVYMLSQQYLTAQGIRSARTITIEKNKIYELSIWVYAVNVHGAGASIILSGADSKDIVIKGIAKETIQENKNNIYLGSQVIEPNTGYASSGSTDGQSNGGWTKYSFYLKGNAYKDFSYNMTVWLGTGGTTDNHAVDYLNQANSGAKAVTYKADGTFANGWLFIDELALNEITSDDWTAKETELGGTPDEDNGLEVDVTDKNVSGIVVDLSTEPGADEVIAKVNGFLENPSQQTSKSELGDKLVMVGSGAPTGWSSAIKADDPQVNPITDSAIYEGVVDINSKEAFDNALRSALDEGSVTYPDLPYAMPLQKAYMLYSKTDGYYEVESQAITISANSYYRISFWLKTVDIKSSSGAYVYLLNKTAQAEDKLNAESVATSITRINTADYDTYLKDWVEINLVIKGGEKDTDLALKLTLGTGSRFDNTTRTSGAMYVANFNMASITHANYTDTSTGTYTKSVDLSSAASTSGANSITNGNFNNYDHDDEHIEAGKALTAQSVPALPSDWTISDNTLDINSIDHNGFAGVIALNKSEDGKSFTTSDQATSATGLDESIFNSFYGNVGDADTYYSDDNQASIAGPEVLAIGSKNDEKFAIGFASQSITLSANSYYVLSVYARTENSPTASIFLTGESSSVGENTFELVPETDTSADGKWTKFTFYIEVGKASVNIKLNLWLGKDPQYQTRTADQEDMTDDEFKEVCSSSGVVFFDNVIYKSIDKDEYDKAKTETSALVKTISFMTDSFDALSSTVSSRGTINAPTGWTGAAGTNQSSSNSIAGIIYADDSYYETKTVGDDAVNYVGILGKDYDADSSIAVSDEELNTWKQNNSGENLSDADIIDRLLTEKRNDLKRKNWIPVEALQPLDNGTSNRQMLVINNTSKSAYTYTSSSSTLDENSFYKVSVWVHTYGIGAGDYEAELTEEEIAEAKASGDYEGLDDDAIKAALIEKKQADYIKDMKAGAYIELHLGSANETNNKFIFESIITDDTGANAWQKFTFFVRTRDAEVTSVALKLSLGNYESTSEKDSDGNTIVKGLTNGYAMFDDVDIVKTTENEYLAAEELTDEQKADQHILTRYVKASTGGTPSTEDNGETGTAPTRNFNLDYLWWMIPTIVLGVMIVAVVIVFLFRKFYKPSKKGGKVKKSSAPVVTETLDEKHDRYDEDKE